jgi:hypothetical protein
MITSETKRDEDKKRLFGGVVGSRSTTKQQQWQRKEGNGRFGDRMGNYAQI